ncbi:MAG TPA: glycosyltransferase family A protein [Bacteroidota bacterium]|nr:glycosyltransferase family A protein [Candidatus Kapabacteria bacterium]HRS02227.1 glycosyltransferase family A protein [Bacteroidota bacterium]HRT67894.1 glycosyltransferase family A protein [Bacteroidota bacterium]
MDKKQSIEVLVATMNQSDCSLYQKMNLQTDAIIANQSDHFDYIEDIINGKSIKMITTSDRGVGKNRNIALLNASADILIFADDDMVFVDNYEDGIIKAFERLPNADIIIFEVDINANPDREDKRKIRKIGRVRTYNFMRYGTYRIVCRRNSILKKNIWFSILYGGGAQFSSGEDNLFLREALKKHLRIYKYPFKTADMIQKESSWFEGYNERYFIDRGVLIANAFPVLKYIVCIYFAFRFKSFTNEYNVIQIFQLLIRGVKKFNEM